jgi:hypothetical protein
MALKLLRHFELVVLALALPLFLAADLPLLGYAVGAGAWLLQRGIQLLLERRASQSDDPRTVVGLTAGGMIGRGWLVAFLIFGVGIAADDAVGLSAAVLFIAVFTVYFTTKLIFRPLDKGGLGR